MRATSLLASLLLATSLVHALPSDALLDSLTLASAEQERLDRLSDRDQTESLLEMLIRQRMVSDSAPDHPRKIMAQLEQMRSERARREAEEQAQLRKPPPEVAQLLAQDSDPLPPPDTATITAKAPPAPPLPATVAICATGPVRIEWLPTATAQTRRAQDSIFPFKVRIDAPCGLSRIDLFMDEALLRSFPVPTGKVGSFEFSDAVVLAKGIHRLDIVACDSTGICSRSTPLESKLVDAVAPWIPYTVGGLVGLCVLLGLALFLRKWTHHPQPSRTPNHTALPNSTGVSATIRHRLQEIAKEIGPSFPAVSLRLPDSPPRLAIDPELLGEVFGNLLRLHARRAQAGGQILIAMGHGPLSAEIVFEDTADTPDEASIPLLLDPSKPRLKERMELDGELEAARQLLVKANGSLAMEARIDGGLRTRMRLKLAPQKTKA